MRVSGGGGGGEGAKRVSTSPLPPTPHFFADLPPLSTPPICTLATQAMHVQAIMLLSPIKNELSVWQTQNYIITEVKFLFKIPFRKL